MESAIIQTLIAAIVVLGAALFLARRAWRTVVAARRGTGDGASCTAGGGCGCASERTETEPEALRPSGRG
jgi:hypothetical protein